eukprot:UN02803
MVTAAFPNTIIPIYDTFVTLWQKEDAEFTKYVYVFLGVISLVKEKGKITKLLFDKKNGGRTAVFMIQDSSFPEKIIEAVDMLNGMHKNLVVEVAKKDRKTFEKERSY